MDGYPESFLAHMSPCMFVTGMEDFPTTEASDPFAVLAGSLRKALLARRGFQIWSSSRGTAPDFHTVLVPKATRLPPRKSDSGHSPISPLSPGSPLHPDGLMAPVWIRKHRELVPSVFVVVARLWEPDTSSDPLASDQEARTDEERRRDAELVKEIAERKRVTTDRGIKLAVILLASRELLDSSELDARLSLLRRQAGLDARASLFVLSPVPTAEVAAFVSSLRAELFPSAVDYYREHGRRARRKRSRVPTRTDTTSTLNAQGWTCRYDYKTAVFAELRQEIDVALKHYEDCYTGLVDLLSLPTTSPGSLAPRTKRWAEAKVLSDCISCKISKLYLYLDDSAHAVSQLNKHVALFRELCNRWQIGESTFEYWSWLSKQYRLFADLIDIATRSGFRLPAPGLGVAVPCHALYHPGHYYVRAARCATTRRDRFRSIDPSATPSPALAHEQTVNHTDQILELYTKAYELFKKQKADRQTVAIAHAIALVHHDAGHEELALKFIERIAKTYRANRWWHLLEPLLGIAVEAAQKQGDSTTAIKAAIELLALASRRGKEVQTTAAAALKSLLDDMAPAEASNVVFDVESALPLILGESVPLKLTLSSPDLPLDISAVRAEFGENHEPIVFDAHDGQSKLESTVSSTITTILAVQAVVLVLKRSTWTIEVRSQPTATSSCTFAVRPPRARLDLSYATPAMLGEPLALSIEVKNEDDHVLNATCDVRMQGESDDRLEKDGQSGQSLSDLSIGALQPGSDTSLAVSVIADQTPGLRQLSVTVRCSPVDSSEEPLVLSRTLAIDFQAPFGCDTTVRWLRHQFRAPGLGDLATPSPFDDSWLVMVAVSLGVAVDTALEIVDVRFDEKSSSSTTRRVSSSLAHAQMPAVLAPQQRFGLSLTLSICALSEHATIIVDWRRAGSDDTLSSTRLVLPALDPPPLVPIVTVSLPEQIVLHQPTLLTYRLINPSRRKLMRIAAQVDSADGFVFVGPRKTVPFTILPLAEHTIRLNVIAIGQTGRLAIPRLRVFEQVREGEETEAERVQRDVSDAADTSATPILRELAVVTETDRGSTDALTVMVVPG